MSAGINLASMISTNKSIIKLSRNHSINFEVHFATDLFNSLTKSTLQLLCRNNKLFIVIDKNVYNLYSRRIDSFFKNCNCLYKIILIEALEENKTMKTVTEICQAAKDFQMKRNSIFIGIGGGITLDILGFAAFLFRRKTRYIRIPTTLVGLVDAGVGVKVGVNFDNAKNLIGGYYAPIATFNDQSFLKTLDISNIRSGLYEIVKMGLVNDKKLFQLTEQYYKDFLNNNFNNKTDEIIYLSAFSMMKELEPNLHEHNLKRSVDFGHTFSTFIEESSGYSMNHGEAVGLDILISSFISLQRGILSQHEFNRIFNLISSIGFTTRYQLASLDKFYNSLDNVRNHRAGDLNLVLPSKIGSCIFTNECLKEELEKAVDFSKDFIHWGTYGRTKRMENAFL